MTPIAVYAGVIVSDLARSVPWYVRTLGGRVSEEGSDWACLRLADDSAIELVLGDAEHPGLSFHSYGGDPGPPVLPGYAVADPRGAAAGLRVVHHLPEWIVVVAPDGVRLVLTDREGAGDAGLIGFRFASPRPDEQAAFLGRLGIDAEVVAAERPAVVPVLAGRVATILRDPDGTPLEIRPAAVVGR